MKLLHIDSSIMSEKSVSRGLSADVVTHIKNANSDVSVTYYDLDTNLIPYFSSASFTDEKQQALGELIMNDFMTSDVIVIGAPMYNFGIPAQLKSWIDRIAVAGKTFKYTENGSVGLVSGKKVIIVSSRGGVYSGDLSFLDHQEAHLKAVFGFMGITDDDITIIRAEGVNLGPSQAEAAIKSAKSEILKLEI